MTEKHRLTRADRLRIADELIRESDGEIAELAWLAAKRGGMGQDEAGGIILGAVRDAVERIIGGGV